MQSAATKGSNNLAGVSDPVVDALMDEMIAADTRPKLVFAARALDRVIRAGRYWVPQWYANSHRLAYWNVFAHPANLPKYIGVGAPDLWWSTANADKPEQAQVNMSAYIARRILLMFPTLLGILFVSFVVVQFAPGGPVERVIAQLSGADTGASSRVSRIVRWRFR